MMQNENQSFFSAINNILIITFASLMKSVCVCVQCVKYLRSVTEWKVHSMRHFEIKLYMCDLCYELWNINEPIPRSNLNLQSYSTTQEDIYLLVVILIRQFREDITIWQNSNSGNKPFACITCHSASTFNLNEAIPTSNLNLKSYSTIRQNRFAGRFVTARRHLGRFSLIHWLIELKYWPHVPNWKLTLILPWLWNKFIYTSKT